MPSYDFQLYTDERDTPAIVTWKGDEKSYQITPPDSSDLEFLKTKLYQYFRNHEFAPELHNVNQRCDVIWNGNPTESINDFYALLVWACMGIMKIRPPDELNLEYPIVINWIGEPE